MKKLVLLLVASTIFVALNAQIQDSKKSPNEFFFHNHLIRIHKATSSGYLYDIFFQSKLVIQQKQNPFTGTSDGLKTKDDALKIAKWQIIHLYPSNRNGQPGNNLQKIPMAVARQLDISVN